MQWRLSYTQGVSVDTPYDWVGGHKKNSLTIFSSMGRIKNVNYWLGTKLYTRVGGWVTKFKI